LDQDPCGLRLGVPCGISSGEINDEPHSRNRFEFRPPDAESMDLDQAAQPLCRPDKQAACSHFQVRAIVCNKPGKRQVTLSGSRHEVPCER
jgi:hypothetical protein